MQDDKVSGPKDNMVSEMIKQLPLGFVLLHECEMFPGTFHGPREGSKYMENCEFVVLEEA